MTDATHPKAQSPFLAIPESHYVARNGLAFAIRDGFPVSPGHTLVIPFREVATWFDATVDEQHALMELVAVVKRQLDGGVAWPDGRVVIPDGYNVGFNAGTAAGQTVMHLHVHVIPRFQGDMDDPRGGVRNVIPSKGNYLAKSAPMSTGGDDDPFLRLVSEAFSTAKEIRIVAAFVQQSGLDVLREHVRAAIDRGASVRIVTGDYLAITQAKALRQLLTWQAIAIGSDTEAGDRASVRRGTFAARIVETRTGTYRGRAFHPKAWLFSEGDRAIAFVGSSNISHSALAKGIEWNLGVEATRDRAAFDKLAASFEALWNSAREITPEWVNEYAKLARREARGLPLGEVETDTLEPLPSPHDLQREALSALLAVRECGEKSALVVLATGLGKTLVAVLDYAAFAAVRNQPTRMLFVAHRQEILEQAAKQVEQLVDERGLDATFGWCVGDSTQLDADIVFASIAKLARPSTLAALRAKHFHYVVVDEVHHAAADSYRRVLEAISYDFLLGLTATPERSDAQEYLELFGGAETYRADLDRGVALGRLVPFAYFGVKDEIDYVTIPWRNRRFDTAELAAAAQTEARMQTLLRAWKQHPGTRTLVFCCSIEHAIFVRNRLAKEGLRVRAVFARVDSDDRVKALDDLRDGSIDAICAVDVFNEGVDVREIDRVVFLRPTESRVVFLQQLGRGLRAHKNKKQLTVIDFVGNHRVFVDRLRTLFSLGKATDPSTAVRRFVDDNVPPGLPEGCSVELELEAKQLLERFVRRRSNDAATAAYEELRSRLGRRPTALELLRKGYNPRALRDDDSGWFGFVAAQGDLDEDEITAAERSSELLREVEESAATKSFKFVCIEAFVRLGGIREEGVTVSELADKSWEILSRHNELRDEVLAESRPDGTDAGRARFASYWRENPIRAWAGSKRGRQTAFELREQRLVLRVLPDERLRETLGEMLVELAQMRLHAYRQRATVRESGFRCKVVRNGSGEPILKLPNTNDSPGEKDVRTPNGELWVFRFMKEFCNVAHPLDSTRNRLGDLLRGWFGPEVGASGRSDVVRFIASPDGLWVEPDSAVDVASVVERGRVLAFPDLRAAAGHAQASAPSGEGSEVLLPIDGATDGYFAVRVSGSSMDGGKQPMRDGDWAVLEPSRGVAASSLEGRVVLAETPGVGDGFAYQLKRLVRTDAGWELRSDHPTGPTIVAREPMKIVARLARVVSPESIAPTLGTMLTDDALARAFGIDELASRTGRYGGHLFAFLETQGALKSPTEVVSTSWSYRPGETAFVLARRDDGRWKYLGVGRRAGDEAGDAFVIPEVDHETWRALGDGGRSASRVLADGARREAERIVEAMLAIDEPRRVTRGDGRIAYVRERAAGGGLRVDGGEGGFAARTVSLTDIAWVVMAVRELGAVGDGGVGGVGGAGAAGGVLDEARVNRVRYLEGTPKGATRWIDTGWAIAVVQRVAAGGGG